MIYPAFIDVETGLEEEGELIVGIRIFQLSGDLY